LVRGIGVKTRIAKIDLARRRGACLRATVLSQSAVDLFLASLGYSKGDPTVRINANTVVVAGECSLALRSRVGENVDIAETMVLA